MEGANFSSQISPVEAMQGLSRSFPLLAFVAVAVAFPLGAPIQGKCIDGGGNTYGHGSEPSAAACEAVCVADGLACIGWEFKSGSCSVYNGWTSPVPATKDGDCTIGFTATFVPPTPPPIASPPKGAKPAIFFMSDDLRPDLDAGDYGLDYGHTPNFRRLTDRALTFRHAYIQYPYCAPSRNSYMSGRRPDATKAYSFVDNFREVGVGDQWSSLPEHFLRNGYFTGGFGKTFHPGVPAFNDQNRSWTIPYDQGKQNASNLCDSKCCGADGEWVCQWDLKPTTQLQDMNVISSALENLQTAAAEYKATGKPFALFIGTHKPHLRWDFPKSFFDNIPDNVTEAPNPAYPVSAPEIHFHDCAEMSQAYFNTDGVGTALHPPAWQALMRRSYYACVSYVDSLLGQVLDALDDFGVADDTIIVSTGDHGWNLGEHALWCKMCVNENTARVPLIIADPSKPQSHGKVTSALAELVDIFPTMVELAGLEAPTGPAGASLGGVSLAPVLEDPTATVKDVALSQMARCWQNNTRHDPNQFDGPGDESNHTVSLMSMSDCHWVRRDGIDFQGYSVRTADYRYTEWYTWNGNTLRPNFDEVVAVEMYNHTVDMGTAAEMSLYENYNLGVDCSTKYPELCHKLSTTLRATIQKYITPNPPSFKALP